MPIKKTFKILSKHVMRFFRKVICDDDISSIGVTNVAFIGLVQAFNQMHGAHMFSSFLYVCNLCPMLSTYMFMQIEIEIINLELNTCIHIPLKV